MGRSDGAVEGVSEGWGVMKFCKGCKNDLDESKYYNDKSQKDGLGNKCRECITVRNRECRIRNAPNNRFIYGIFDPTNGELKYVGCTVDHLEHRLATHLVPSALNRRNHRSNWLNSVLAKGLNPQMRLLIDYGDISYKELLKLEIYWIKHYRLLGFKLVNATDGGEGMLGYKHSEEARRNMSECKKGIKQSEESKQKRSRKLKGRPRPAEVIANMSKAQKGKPHTWQRGIPLTKEHRNGIAMGHGGRAFTGSDGQVWFNRREAERFYGLYEGAIAKILKGKINRARGLTFRYIDVT